MNCLRRYPGTKFRLALIAVLIFVQTGVLMHALEHGLDTSQDQACATCVTAHAAASGCIDSQPECLTHATVESFHVTLTAAPLSTEAAGPQQRAPPALPGQSLS